MFEVVIEPFEALKLIRSGAQDGHSVRVRVLVSEHHV